ncbi:coiled-coil domain-containing protein 9 isoform X1 [Alexandromys fortis]|uniref:coiled-coil domain-containing protein 9 isoform X1 n=1 Tax=Alexandromys fortis TaxID=100897 RepID=UPI0021526C3A|nr:coiled-coil domain-containing protein 9 isoform X1 [Microtus fortis]XP_049986244.1 coiled-coil domain-containing protein 9 isoform X1 [Microtus fortis]XP_049986245.1 coiled-coil domain-containing protein 9 isoform X1 [Microtus fortis]XP_049986246.1 coiled-coil domain-containing protein 9 isoform X1 [Microtus fortis]
MATTLDLKSKEEKDAELDKRIEALRRKNEALIRRYQEIEEDRKNAESEGVAVTAPRKSRSMEKENVAVEEKSLGPSRRTPGTPRPSGANRGGRTHPQQGGRAGVSRASRGWENGAGEQLRGGTGGRGQRGRGRGSPHLLGDSSTSDRKSKEWEERRRQNIEKMNEEMEKIAEYERNQREGVLEPNPVRNFLDDPRRRAGPLEEPERDRREGSRRHGRNWGGSDFDRVRSGLEHERQGRRAGLGCGGDMTMSMTGRERSDYLRWKQEREKIDQERLQRHRKPTGQWRREWDAEKTDGMFKDEPAPTHELSHRYDDQTWARPPKPPTFGEFLSQHKAEVKSRRRRKNSRPQAKVAPHAYSDHDNRWETKEEAVSSAPESSQSLSVEEAPTRQPPETPAPAHRPPEEDGEEDEGEEEGEEEREDDDEDEEWEDVSEDITEEEEDDEEEEEEFEEEEEECPKEQEAPAVPDHQPGEAEPARKPTCEQADPAPARPQESLSPVPVEPPSPLSPTGDHQPVSDWGGDQPALASLESGPTLTRAPKSEEEGPEASPGGVHEAGGEVGPEGQETAEITDFQRVRFCKVVAATPPPGAAR